MIKNLGYLYSLEQELIELKDAAIFSTSQANQLSVIHSNGQVINEVLSVFRVEL